MSERPLHVRVAEAIGWTRCRLDHADVWIGMAPGYDDYAYNVPRYDTDWSVTGPLIERLRFGIDGPAGREDPAWASPPREGDPALSTWQAWTCSAETAWEIETAEGSSPLDAVCNLILALHAAGKLPKVSA